MMVINSKLGLWIFFVITIVNYFIDASPSPNNQNALDNLYDNLLQREFTDQVSLPEYMRIERKAQRSSPSLRLRFGRSDPSVSTITHEINKRWFGDVNQKPIRSPSFRLRFGKRNDLNDINKYDSDYELDYDNADLNMDEFERKIRAPTFRLRYGKRAPKLRLRYGRSIPFDLSKRVPQLRLRYGRSAPTLLNDEPEENNDNYDDVFYGYEKRPSMRLRFGRSSRLSAPSNENDLLKDYNENISLTELLRSLGYSEESIKLMVFNALKQNVIDDTDFFNPLMEKNQTVSNLNEFDRETRKSRQNGAVRLRWGRSINNKMDERKLHDPRNDLKQKYQLNLIGSTTTSATVQG